VRRCVSGRQPLHHSGMPLQHLPCDVPHSAQQMKAIRHLDGSWCALFHPFSILPAAISADNLDARMLPQPSGNCANGAVGKEVHGPMALEIHQDRPVHPAFAKGEILYGENRGCQGRHTRESADGIQDRLSTGCTATTMEQPSAGSATTGNGHVHKPAGKARCTACIGCSYRRGPLGNDVPLTGHVVTEEAAGMQAEPDGDAAPWQISKGTLVQAVDTTRGPMAERAPRFLDRRRNKHRDHGLRRAETDEAKLRGIGEKGSRHGEHPWNTTHRAPAGAHAGIR
jgi:hypothetical protein